MTIEAKPTEYAGVLFRSRLEATWARFFDVIGVAWEYEPTRLEGWIPDFLIAGWWLAEVKPHPIIWGGVESHADYAKAVRKFDTLLLGDGPSTFLGLVVRRMNHGGIFARRLLVDMAAKETELEPVAWRAPDRECALTALWAGVSQGMSKWGSAGTINASVAL